MALINRISRLFKADLHAVLDKIEEPEVLLKQAIREMEMDITSNEQELKHLTEQKKELKQLQQNISDKIKKLAEEMELCFQTENKDLAKSLVRRQLEAKRYYEFLQQQQQRRNEVIESLTLRITENMTRLQSMQQKLEMLPTQHATTDYINPSDATNFNISDDEIEIAFLQAQKLRQTS